MSILEGLDMKVMLILRNSLFGKRNSKVSLLEFCHFCMQRLFVFFIPTFFVSEEFYHWNSIYRQVPPPLQWKVPPNCRTSSPLGCCPLLHLHHPRWHVPWQFYGHLMDKRSSAVEALSWQLTLVSYYSIKLEGLFHKFSMKDENKIIKKQCYVMYFSLLVVYLYICLKCSSVLPIDSL